jgi:radical SAM protein with 4Fe4S-binding SPASM domain
MHLFKKAVDDFISMQGTTIDFNTTVGEPLLDPYLLERARYVRQFTQVDSLGFVTNLQWLHKFDIDEFYAAGFSWLGISTVLSGREKYLDFFGVDRYGQVIKNILRLFEENKKRKNKITLRFSIKPTDEPISAVINHPDFKTINSLSQWDLVDGLKRQTFICDDWIGSVKLPTYLKKRPLYLRLFRPCRMLYDSLIVYSNGNIGACLCRDFEANSELILGNVREMAIKETWKSSKLFNIRSGWHKNNKIPQICKRCTHYLC